ncbi:MAG TPA: serine/threonine protein kinase, partial [Nannocystis exedens]|nr:serine/threonine protein kinase [Nannocystis exedens]
ARVRHPNVLTIYDVGEFEEGVYIATELVEGVDLQAWLAAEVRSLGELLAVFVDAGRGLLAVHEVGLVHRDFKPKNVLIGHGRVRVADFGLASAGSKAAAEGKTRGPVIAGTPAYMAPEQLRGEVVDARADQFAFCLSLCEALFGVGLPEFESGSDLRLQRVHEVLHGGARKPGVGRPPPWLRRALARGLQANPDDRFPSMAELLGELERAPRVRRRNLQTMAAVGALVVVAVGARMSVEQPDGSTSPCIGVAAPLQAQWGPERREGVKAAILAIDSPFADGTWRLVSAVLDDYAERWSAARVDVCEATHLRYEQSGELMDLRVACLSRGAEQFAATLDLLEAGAQAPAEVERAIDAVEGLPRIELCDDIGSLQALVPAPENPEIRRGVEELRRRLAVIRVEHRFGRYERVLRLATQLRAEALSLEYPPLLAEIDFLIGANYWDLGQPHEAEEVLLRAIWAADSSRHDEVSLGAATTLVGLLGSDLNQSDRARDWTGLARAANRRMGIADGWSSRLAQQAAMACLGEQNFAEGLRLANFALERAASSRERT